MRTAAVVLASSLVFCAGSVRAGTNGLDASFGSGGIVRFGATPVSGLALGRLRALHVQDDGSILVGGYVYGPPELPAIGRLTPDGQWDATFGDHGAFVLPNGADAAPYGGRITALATFSTGAILAAGGTYQSGGNYYSCTLLIKLTTLGALDTTFAPDKSGSYCFDFAPPPLSNYWLSHWNDIAVDSDDTFFLTAISTNLNRGAVAHLDASGTLVNTYGTNGIAGLPDGIFTNRIELLAGHQVLAAGVVSTPTSEAVGASIVDAKGGIDLSYGSSGVASLDEQPSTYYGTSYSALDQQGRLLLSSDSTTGADTSPYRIERFTAAGAGDATFNDSGQQPGSPGVAVLALLSPPSPYDSITGATPLADGHILVVGSVGQSSPGDGIWNIALVRLNADASYDTGFGQSAHAGWTSVNAGGLADSLNQADALAVDGSGRVIVVFGGTDANGVGCSGLLRIIPDRLLDASFDPAPPLPTCP